MTQTEVKINLYSQDNLSKADGIDWFDSLDNDSKSKTLELLYWFIINTKPTKDEIELSIINTNLKRTSTPIVLILKEQINISIPNILDLPAKEWNKVFLILIEIFKTSDKRRRISECKGNCSHEWHNIKK